MGFIAYFIPLAEVSSVRVLLQLKKVPSVHRWVQPATRPSFLPIPASTGTQFIENNAVGALESCQLLRHLQSHLRTKHLVIRRARFVGQKYHMEILNSVSC